MSDLKYIPKQNMERISLDAVTSSPEERADIEMNMSTPEERKREESYLNKRNVSQNEHWKKQMGISVKNKKKNALKKLSEAYMQQLFMENVSDNSKELKIISDKIHDIILSIFTVKEKREYMEQSNTQFQVNNFFEKEDMLDEMEDKIFKTLKRDVELKEIVEMSSIPDEERDYFIKRAVRAERSSVYRKYLNNL